MVGCYLQSERKISHKKIPRKIRNSFHIQKAGAANAHIALSVSVQRSGEAYLTNLKRKYNQPIDIVK